MSISSPDELFEFYRNTFLPAYSDLVGFSVAKPKQVLTELENTLAHLAQYHNPALDNTIKMENLRKANDHLMRVTLDCYKLLWIGMSQELETFYNDEKKRVFALNIPEEEFLKKYNAFKEKAQTARWAELNSVGVKPLAAVESYKEVIVIGKELLNSIDHNKLQKLNRFRKIVFIKETGVAFLIGLASGYIANAFWNFNDSLNHLKSFSSGIWNYLFGK